MLLCLLECNNGVIFMSFLSYDGLLARCIRYVWRLFLLNICYVICCLPVFTIGAANAALYAAFLNESNDSGTVVPFFLNFKSNFKQATKLWLILAVPFVLLIADWFLIITLEFAGEILVTIGSAIFTVIYCSVFSFVFPLQAHYENTLGKTLHNSLVLGIGMVLYGVFFSTLALLPVILFFVDLNLFLHFLSFWIFLGFSFTANLQSMILKHIFNTIQPRS